MCPMLVFRVPDGTDFTGRASFIPNDPAVVLDNCRYHRTIWIPDAEGPPPPCPSVTREANSSL
jgi:hypothetical protein